MKRLAALALTILAVAALSGTAARAEDEVRLSRNAALVGEHIAMTVRITAPTGATVELTPGNPSWAGVELVSIESVNQVNQAEGVLWLFQAQIAPFAPGPIAFAPTAAIIRGADSQNVALPAVSLDVVRSLAADAPLELTPLAPPVGIAGAESPWLRPGVALGVLAGCALLAAFLWLAGRAAVRRLRRPSAGTPVPQLPQTLVGAEQILHSDPVAAYRLMSHVVKMELERRYGVRATALTTTELKRRLETGGERWEARLVSGLLEECDSVIYAGYRPAAERREADLTMAREIVEVAG
ncbi:MAG: hypothetical protein ABI577_06970 [bacterium]